MKPRSKCPIVKVDLTTPHGEALAKSWLSNPLCAYAHWGIPCGTASRAREIDLNDGEYQPQPLRNDAYPEGLPWLTGDDAERVRLANKVYEVCCRLILFCHCNNIRWSLEQPERSIFWLTKFWRMVLQHLTPIYVVFSACMYGGSRPKRTAIATDIKELQQLACDCTGNHKHLPWGRTKTGFATAAEVEYPLELCKAWAAAVFRSISKQFDLEQSVLPAHPDKKARASTVKQTRKSLAFMQDYSHVETARFQRAPKFRVGSKLPATLGADDATLPAYARILRISQIPSHQDGGKSSEKATMFEVAFGVPWSEEAFIKEALLRGHPVHLFESLHSNLSNAIRSNVNEKPEKIVTDRAAWFKKWTRRALELRKQEADLHKKMPSHRRQILEGKRILLLREIIEDMNYPDPGIVDLIEKGFDLVGEAGGGLVLPRDFEPATMSIQDLADHAKSSNEAIFHSTKSSGDSEVDEELWKKTCEEVEKGWLSRLPLSEVPHGRLSRRFAVVQGGKVRPIDNYSESQVNDAVNVTSKCTVDGTDCIAAMIAEYMRLCEVKSVNPELLGRSFDLKSAYRQLAVSDSSLKWARLAVYNPSLKITEVFQQHSLPFGAKASVIGFLRCARLIQWLAHSLSIMVTCYFDDYVCVAPSNLARNTDQSFCLLLDLLGWRYGVSGEKSDSMSHEISALGVMVDLSETSEGRVMVRNTEKRKQDLSNQIDRALSSRRLTTHEATSLKGRLGFAEGQLFGRATKRLINVLGQHVLRPPKRGVLSDETVSAMLQVKGRLLNAQPRLVKADVGDVFFLFTDACFDCEAKEGGVGGVLIDQTGCVVSWFGGEASRDFCESFMAEDQEQAIGELEAFVVLVAFRVWQDLVRSKHLLCFIDNEAARYLILKGYSKNPVLCNIVHHLAKVEEELFVLPWYARVPSECNIADPPSRSVPHELLPETSRVPMPDLRSVLDEASKPLSAS